MSPGPPGAGRMLAAAVALFLVAILMGRLLWHRGELWQVFLLALPVLLLLLSLALGFLRAAILLAFFVATVLTVRWIVSTPGIGWPVVALGLVLLLASVIATRVVRILLHDRRQRFGKHPEKTGDKGEEKEEGNVGIRPG